MIKEDLKILTLGEKLKKIRKTIRATQEDIGGEELTKSYISAIENNKVPKISDAAANSIVKNVNKLITAKNINIEQITVEWLLENRESQAKRNVDKILIELSLLKLSRLDINTINLIEEVLLDYAYTNKDRELIYEKISILYKKKDISEAIFFNLKATELSFINKDFNKYVLLRLKLIGIYFSVSKFEEVIYKARLAIEIYNTYNLKIEEIKYIKFDLALAYKETNNITKCLETLSEIKKKYSYTSEQISRIKILEANCLMDKKMYNEAKKIYLEELEKNIYEENNINVATIYRFLARIAIKHNEEKAEYYIAKALSISGLDEIEIANNSYYACKFYIHINKKQLVNKYFRDALTQLKQLQNDSKIEKLVYSVVSYYCNDQENLKITWENIRSANLNSEKLLKAFINIMKCLAKFDDYSAREVLVYIEKMC